MDALTETAEQQVRDLLVFGSQDQELLSLVARQVEPHVIDRYEHIRTAGYYIAEFLAMRLDQLQDILAWNDPTAAGFFSIFAQQATTASLAARWFFAEVFSVDADSVFESVAPGLPDRLVEELAGVVLPEDVRPDLITGYREMFLEWWT